MASVGQLIYPLFLCEKIADKLPAISAHATILEVHPLFFYAYGLTEEIYTKTQIGL